MAQGQKLMCDFPWMDAFLGTILGTSWVWIPFSICWYVERRNARKRGWT